MYKQSSLKNWFKSNPVFTYYVITFLISWGGLVLVVGGPGRVSSHPFNAPFLPLYFVTVAGPCIAGILLTGLYDGIKGYREFFSRLVKWKVKANWYAAACLIAPLSVFAALFVLSLFSPGFLPGIFSSGDNHIASIFGLTGNNRIMLFSFVLLLGLFNGFVEELGWTGFLTHRLKFKHSFIATGINIGIMWGLWHLLSNYVGSAAGAGTVPLLLYIAVILFSFLPPFRILMIWVYENTGSVLIAILMHASLDVFWILSMPVVLTGQQRVTWYLVWASFLWVFVVTVIKIRSHLERPQNK